MDDGDAAELGDADGQLNLGLSYAEGSGVECDYQEAKKWWRLAAEQGNKEAVRALAALDKLLQGES